MQVKRDFETLYHHEQDPWQIGDADAPRYRFYQDLLLQHARHRGHILEIGCGMGAFLARFQQHFDHLSGVDISREAVRRGAARFPFITFAQGDAVRPLASGTFDAILYSDVICYLTETHKRRSLQWIHDHLAPEGVALIAGWSPGGRYLTHQEFSRLIRHRFRVVAEDRLDTGHSVFVVQRRRHLIAITVDYETWHPPPPGRNLNWEEDVFVPTSRLLQIADDAGTPVTLMAEMGEYFYLEKNHPPVAARMAQQWQEAVRRGHDVQLHLHPNWLPELGAHFDGQTWHWDWSKAKAADFPGDLTALIGRCRTTLETLLLPIDPTYQVTCFRAGAYQAQPFKRLHEALTANGIGCDSSVFEGGQSLERGYDYRLAYSQHQPYFTNAHDPQLKAPPSEERMIELPILTDTLGRWFLDDQEGQLLAKRVLRFIENKDRLPASEWFRLEQQIKDKLGALYWRMRPLHPWLNRILPRGLAHWFSGYDGEVLAGHRYYVMIGHTKANLDLPAIRDNLGQLQADGRFEFVTLSRMADVARADLRQPPKRNAQEEACFQVARETEAVLGEVRNTAPSAYLQNQIPWDREDILDLGCGAGYWSDAISQQYPWARVVGVDAGERFIERAQSRYASDQVSFQVADFLKLPFEARSFDLVYADNSLEHAYDVDATLAEIQRVLRPQGMLVAALPSDARNPRRTCDNHTWKTAPHEVGERLEAAGFASVSIREIDTYRKLGMPPYPPANDRMMMVVARKQAVSQQERALELLHWVHRRLNPERPSQDDDAKRILLNGYAWCWGYAHVLREALRHEGFITEWISMTARNHPKGRGKEQLDTHEVIQVRLADDTVILLDATCGTWFPHSVNQLVKQPKLANGRHPETPRFLERQYALYCTSFWYERVVDVRIRR